MTLKVLEVDVPQGGGREAVEMVVANWNTEKTVLDLGLTRRRVNTWCATQPTKATLIRPASPVENAWPAIVTLWQVYNNCIDAMHKMESLVHEIRRKNRHARGVAC